MDARILLRIICTVAACILLLSQVSGQDMHGPPIRPKVFKNADELRLYLKALNEYFAIVGRPRFGKRSSSSSFANSAFGEVDIDGNGRVDQDEFDRFVFSYRK